MDAEAETTAVGRGWLLGFEFRITELATQI